MSYLRIKTAFTFFAVASTICSLSSPHANSYTADASVRNPAKCDKLITRSRWLWSVERTADALHDAASAVQTAPDCFAAQLNYANLLQVTGDCDRALAHYSRALRINSGSTAAILGRAQCLAIKGDSKASFALLDNLFLRNNDSETWYQIGTVYLLTGMQSRSARCYERALASLNRSARVPAAQIKERLLLAYIGSGAHTRVQQMLHDVIRQSRSAEVYEAAVQWACDANKLAEAEAVIAAAEARFSYSPDLLYRLGWMLKRRHAGSPSLRNKWDDLTLRTLNDAHRLDPGNQKTVILIAEQLEQEWGTETALKQLAKMKPQEGESPFQRFSRKLYGGIDSATSDDEHRTGQSRKFALLKTTASLKLQCGCRIDSLVDHWCRRQEIISVQIDRKNRIATILSDPQFTDMQQLLGQGLKQHEYATVSNVASVNSLKQLYDCIDLNPPSQRVPLVLELQPLSPRTQQYYSNLYS